MIHTVVVPQNIVKYTVGLSMTLKKVLKLKVLSGACLIHIEGQLKTTTFSLIS